MGVVIGCFEYKGLVFVVGSGQQSEVYMLE